MRRSRLGGFENSSLKISLASLFLNTMKFPHLIIIPFVSLALSAPISFNGSSPVSNSPNTNPISGQTIQSGQPLKPGQPIQPGQTKSEDQKPLAMPKPQIIPSSQNINPTILSPKSPSNIPKQPPSLPKPSLKLSDPKADSSSNNDPELSLSDEEMEALLSSLQANENSKGQKEGKEEEGSDFVNPFHMIVPEIAEEEKMYPDPHDKRHSKAYKLAHFWKGIFLFLIHCIIIKTCRFMMMVYLIIF